MGLRPATKEEMERARAEGHECETRILGVLRGGYEIDGIFYFMAGMDPKSVDLRNSGMTIRFLG